MNTKPLFVVMSAPSGCGKSTLIDLLLQEYPDLVYSISCTTRAPREGTALFLKNKTIFAEFRQFQFQPTCQK